jgi:hypothetical protein
MSRKRKAQETIFPVQSKRNGNAVSVTADVPAAPLSAFAAARARAAIANSEPVEAQPLREPAHSPALEAGEARKSKKPRKPKSRRRDENINFQPHEFIDSDDVFSQLPASTSYPMPEPDDFWDPSQDYLSDDLSHQEPEEAARPELSVSAPPVRFSTWTPTKHNIISSTPNCDRFFMSNGETLCILGQYRLRVHDGLVTVAGVFLAQGAAAVDVFAPATSSLPVIKCISSEGAEIELSHPIGHTKVSISGLGRLSPLYGSICGNSLDSKFPFTKVRPLS